jgi:hypothetical protein
MILSSLGLVFLLIAIGIVIYAIIYIASNPAIGLGAAIALAGAVFISGPLWLLSTILYVAGYFASRNTRSRSLAILFIAGGVINLFNGLAIASLTVFLMIQYRSGIYGVEELLPFIAAIILILAGIAFISMGRRRKI